MQETLLHKGAAKRLKSSVSWQKKQGKIYFMKETRMKLKRIDGAFSVCRLDDFSQVNFDAAYCFTGKTDEENSLVCLTEDAPDNVIEREDGWRGFRIQGVLDFSLVGILAGISQILAENGIGIFALSTYNTDYIFTKQKDYEKALRVLAGTGYCVV